MRRDESSVQQATKALMLPRNYLYGSRSLIRGKTVGLASKGPSDGDDRLEASAAVATLISRRIRPPRMPTKGLLAAGPLQGRPSLMWTRMSGEVVCEQRWRVWRRLFEE